MMASAIAIKVGQVMTALKSFRQQMDAVGSQLISTITQKTVVVHHSALSMVAASKGSAFARTATKVLIALSHFVSMAAAVMGNVQNMDASALEVMAETIVAKTC